MVRTAVCAWYAQTSESSALALEGMSVRASPAWMGATACQGPATNADWSMAGMFSSETRLALSRQDKLRPQRWRGPLGDDGDLRPGVPDATWDQESRPTQQGRPARPLYAQKAKGQIT